MSQSKEERNKIIERVTDMELKANCERKHMDGE